MLELAAVKLFLAYSSKVCTYFELSLYVSHILFNVVSLFSGELLFSKANSTLHMSLLPESLRVGIPKSFDDPMEEKLDALGRLVELALDPLRRSMGLYFSSAKFSALLNR